MYEANKKKKKEIYVILFRNEKKEHKQIENFLTSMVGFNHGILINMYINNKLNLKLVIVCNKKQL